MPKKKKDVFLKEIEIRYKTRRIKGVPKVIGKSVSSSKTVVALFADLQNDTKEKLITINLDVKCKIVCFEVVAIGSLSALKLRPFEVFRTSVMVNTYGTIVVHNHPSGDPNPSQKDIEFTEELKRITGVMGLPFYDHIIIGSEGYFSFLDEGLM